MIQKLQATNIQLARYYVYIYKLTITAVIYLIGRWVSNINVLLNEAAAADLNTQMLFRVIFMGGNKDFWS